MTGRDLVSYVREIQVLGQTDSPFLLNLIGFTITPPFLIITPFIELGSLFNCHQRRIRFSPLEKTIIAMGIANGMATLHQMGIIYRDLKSLNVLIDENRYPKLCDFGIARSDISGATMTQSLGTPQWQAPETFDNGHYTLKADVFSYGVVLWELATGDTPWRGKAPINVSLIVSRGDRPPIPHGVPANIAELIQAAWHQDPSQRPTFAEIYADFERKRFMFEGANPDDLDPFIEFIRQQAAARGMRGSLLAEIMAGGPASPAMIQRVGASVTVENGVDFFNQAKAAIPHATEDQLSNLYQAMVAVVFTTPALAVTFIDLRMADILRWDLNGAVESLHRLIGSVSYCTNRAFGVNVYLRMFEKAAFAASYTTLYALTFAFSSGLDFPPLFQGFLACAEQLCQGGGAGHYSQAFGWILATYTDRITPAHRPGIESALYHVLVSNDPRALHDAYTLYASHSRGTWPMEVDIVRNHLIACTRDPEYARVIFPLLTYMAREFVPTTADFIRPLLQLARRSDLAVMILIRMANDLAASFILDDFNYMEDIRNKANALRLLIVLMRNREFVEAVADRMVVFSFLRDALVEQAVLFPVIATLVSRLPATEAVTSNLIASGLLGELDTIGFTKTDSSELSLLFAVHAKFDGPFLPPDYPELLEVASRVMWTDRALSPYVLAAVATVSGHEDARLTIGDLNIVQQLERGDPGEYGGYCDQIITNCAGG